MSLPDSQARIGVAAAADGAEAATAPKISYGGGPSLRSRLFAVLLRLFVRPLLALVALIAGLGIRFGPRGFELWPIWERLLRLTDLAGVLLPAPRGTALEPVELADCRAEWVRARGVGAGGRVILYLHGGAYVSCGLRTHRRLAARISAASDGRVLSVGYRMLPRNEIGVAVQDGLSAFRMLLAEGISSEQIVIAGDSAGGGLAVLVALEVGREEMPRPAGIVAISPWIELDPSSKLTHRNARTDPMLPISGIAFMFEQLIAKGGPLDPDLSPLERELGELPPVLIHSGTTEVLQHDAIELANRLAAAGVSVELKHWRGQVHVFHVAADLLPEARQAICEIGEFVRETADETAHTERNSR